MAYTYTLTPVVSQVKVGNTNYYLKDSEVRTNLDNLAGIVADLQGVEGIMKFIGITLTQLSDGDTTSPIQLMMPGGTTPVSYTPSVGDVVIDQDTHAEYVWLGDFWELLGDESAYVLKGTTVSVKTSYQPAGTVSQPTFSGTTATITSTASYRPAGTVSQPTFTGTTATITVTSTQQYMTGVTGSVTMPNGTVSKPTFTGTQKSIEVSGQLEIPVGVIASPTFSGTTATITSTASYQPAGSISLTGKTTDTAIKSLATGTALTSAAFTVNNEVLSLNTNTGTFVTGKDATITVVTGLTGATFSGTTATITSTASYRPTGNISEPQFGYSTDTFITVTVTSTGAYTPEGSVSQPTFSWASTNSTKTVAVTLTPTKSTVTSTVSYQPGGTVSQPTFSGTTATITSTTSYRPAGTVSQPTFTGTTATITSTGTIN